MNILIFSKLAYIPGFFFLSSFALDTYTIYAVKQETFLDDIEVPAPQKKEEK